MNKTIGTIKAGHKVTPEELFEVVNAYELTTLSLRASNGDSLMSMQVNQFEIICEGYKFSQKCIGFDDVMYMLKSDDLVSVKGEYNSKADIFHIICKLKNDMKLWLTIVNLSKCEIRIEEDGFYETDVYSIKEFLDTVIHNEIKYYCILAKITDAFGFNLKIQNSFRTYIDTLDDSNWKLHISNDETSVEIPIVDDCINLFYMKEKDSTKEILVKPYGQAFMEIRLLFFRENN